MAVGKKTPSKEKELVKPELVGKSFASLDVPIRTQSSTPQFNSIYQKFPNLNGLCLPFQYNSMGMTISDAVLLCQKAYDRVGTFRAAIDRMSELATSSPIYLDGGNVESKGFFEAWFKKIGIDKLRDQFNRELFLSGNIFLYRVDGSMAQESAKKLKLMYSKAAKVKIPLKYILLNPVNIAVFNGINFNTPIYYRILNNIELQILKNSKAAEDKELYKSLPEAIKSYFNGPTAPAASVPLDSDKLHTIFYKKQDYQPFATPMGFCVLDSIELKLAMQKADSIMSKTLEYVILLVTMGASKTEGGTNPESLKLLSEVFKSEQAGRVLVSDYTTKAEFIVPDLSKILGPDKYNVVNEDIATGLSDVFFSSSSSSNAANIQAKLKFFAEKINNAQLAFVNEFLAPEIKRVSQIMGFKSYPTPSVVKIDLDDKSQMMRVYAQLMQLGVLTPKDGLEAIERGILPDYDYLHKNQENLKVDKDKGLFQPLQGGPFAQIQTTKITQDSALKLADKNQEAQVEQAKLTQQHDMKKTKMTLQHQVENPQPQAPQVHLNTPGSPKVGSPKPTPGSPNPKKIPAPTGRPPGAKASVSMAKLIENIKLHGQLLEAVEAEYKISKNLEGLSENDLKNVNLIAEIILATEKPENWNSSVKKQIENPALPNEEITLSLEQIAQDYDVSTPSAAIISHSLVEGE